MHLVADDMLAVAIEQCCHAERLLPKELRALRLQRFLPDTVWRCQQILKQLPKEGSEAALSFIWWWVRMDRAARTGCPELDPARGPTRTDW